MPDIRFETSYLELPAIAYARTAPTPVSAPHLIRLNGGLASELGLDADALNTHAGLAILSGNAIPPGAASIATAYAGHQFGNFQPQLGDGRAILLGEVVTTTGRRVDVQLKGAGPTPYSRNGDGRAALGPVLREYLVSEAMHALGIPTTRALAAVTTGDWVFRETPLPGAILTRVASSHIRVGTFQFFAAADNLPALRALADHVIERHYPAATAAENRYLALLQAIIARQASLVAQWLLVGFIHGVMNTDNCSIAGETIDFGPCAFLDEYNPGKVFSSIDRGGRYAYAKQPQILQWNLARLAECLLPLIAEDPDDAITPATDALNHFSDLFKNAYFSGLTKKIGLHGAAAADIDLAQDLQTRMAASEADFTNTFRALSTAIDPTGETAAAAQFNDPSVFTEWATKWRHRLAEDPATDAKKSASMNAVNPAYIPRNHLIEAAIEAATAGDFTPFHELTTVLENPFSEQPGRAAFALPPAADQRVTKTFCGT